MDFTTTDAMYEAMSKKSPYEVDEPRDNRPVIVRAGMSAVEMVVWIVIMAVLAAGMIWLLWSTSR